MVVFSVFCSHRKSIMSNFFNMTIVAENSRRYSIEILYYAIFYVKRFKVAQHIFAV